MKLSNITEILGGEKILRKKIQNRMDLVELSDIGVTKDALLNLANYLSCSMSQIATLLSMTERTI